jgi:hypothetical protein
MEFDRKSKCLVESHALTIEFYIPTLCRFDGAGVVAWSKVTK